MQASEKIVLTDTKPSVSVNADNLAQTVIARIGLLPRKKGSTDSMHLTFVEFYERAKKATAAKDPKLAVMTVEEMAIFAKISRQTMYEYLARWTELGIITKVSFIDSYSKVVVGYKLNGTTLEEAFKKAKEIVVSNIDETIKYVSDLQKLLKNEKISAKMKTTSSQEVLPEHSQDQRAN